MRVDLDIAEFDPADLEKLYAQDYVGTLYGSWPAISFHDVREHPDLAQFILNLRNAVKLPFADEFIDGIRAILAYAEECARTRLREAEKRRKDAERYGASHWSNADLLAEIRAICGEGRKTGQWWFVCPFHDDQSPSLEVSPGKKVWKCWGCGKQGGVVEWRKLVNTST